MKTIIEFFKPQPLPAYVIEKREIEDYDLNEKYKKEIDIYTRNFIKANKCNQWSNDYAEYPEYWEGIKAIRKKYGLTETKINCPYCEKR